MDKVSYNGKKRDMPETQRLKKELSIQKELKIRHAERDLELRYSTNFYRKHSPEEVEKKWMDDIMNLKHILDDYEEYLTGKGKQK